MKNSDGLKVRLRNGFSDRMGLKRENIEMQLNAFDDRARVALVNAINLLWKYLCDNLRQEETNSILTNILSDVYVQQVSYTANYRSNTVFELVNNTIMTSRGWKR